MSSFRVNFSFGVSSKADICKDIEFEKDAIELTYDDIVLKLYDLIDDDVPYEEYPNSGITSIFVKEDGKFYPVYEETSESFKKNKPQILEQYGKVLLLPSTHYSATKESLLMCKMHELGILGGSISECIENFDYDKYHSLLEYVKNELQD